MDEGTSTRPPADQAPGPRQEGPAQEMAMLVQHRGDLAKARSELFASVAKFRSGAVSLAVVLVLALLLLQRFIYLTTVEQGLLALLPVAMMVGAWILDQQRHRPRVLELDASLAQVEDAIRANGGGSLLPSEDHRKELSPVASTLYYALPILVLAAWALWRLFF